MKTFATVTGPNGPVKLTFGPSAIESYCLLFKCDTNINSIALSIEKGCGLISICEIIRAGLEQTLFETGVSTKVTDYDACEIIETITPKEEIDATKAFFSLILKQNFDEWYVEQIQLKVNSNYTFVTSDFFGELNNN